MTSLRDLVLKAGHRSHWMQAARMRTYLDRVGWTRSRIEGSPQDAAGAPRAWLALPAIEFLEQRVPEGARVFEWGSGASTEWWFRLGCLVASVEHDAAWAAKNPEVRHVPLGDAYVREIRNHGPIDIALVDGRMRVACMREAVECLTERGVVILDNAERPKYQEGIDHLLALSFRHLPLIGVAPGNLASHTTSILYRDRNVLGL